MGLLRTLFAITVVFAHSPWRHSFVFVGGTNAVQLFYMISGFLISHVICNNRTYSDPLKFYLNRALRIYPIYYVVFLLTPLFTHKFIEVYQNIPFAACALLVFSNLFLFGQDWVMFAGVKHSHLVFTSDFSKSEILLYRGEIVPQAWTLGLELSFYLLAPFILRKWKVVILLAVLSLMLRAYLLTTGIGLQDPWTYRFFPAELLLFLLGVLSNQHLLPLWNNFINSKRFCWIPKIGTYILVGMSLSYFVIPISEVYKIPVLFFVFLILLPLAFLYQNASNIDKIIGDLSYPIYIGHLLAMTIIQKLVSRHWVGDLGISIIDVAGAIVFAYFLNKYIGRRVEKIRERIKSANSKRELRTACSIL